MNVSHAPLKIHWYCGGLVAHVLSASGVIAASSVAVSSLAVESSVADSSWAAPFGTTEPKAVVGAVPAD